MIDRKQVADRRDRDEAVPGVRGAAAAGVTRAGDDRYAAWQKRYDEAEELLLEHTVSVG